MSAYSTGEAHELEAGWFFYSHNWDLTFHLMKRMSGKTVLDVGCGTGLALSLFRSALINLSFRGCEPTDAAADFWKKRGLLVDIGSAENLPYRDEEFDTVICSHVLEHLPDEQVALSELMRVARTRLIVVVPQGNVDEKNFGSPHLRYYNRVSFRDAISKQLPGNARMSLYLVPHPHMDNLVAEIDFEA